MKLVNTLDAKVIALHQRIIDWSQRGREWWMEQCAFLLLIAGIALPILATDMPMWARVLLGIFGFLGALSAFIDSRVQSLMERRAAAHTWRRYTLVQTPLVMLTFMRLADTAGACICLDNVVYLAAMYFAACQPPAPPKKRENEKLEFAA